VEEHKVLNKTKEKQMKTIVTLIIASLLSNTASASFYQIKCSSATGLTKTANGHVDFYTIITNVEYDKNHNRIETPINIDDNYQNYNIEYSQNKEISSENNQHCNPETGSGYSSWKSTYTQKIQITKANGELFPEGISGVNADRTMVTADLICEEDGNSQIFCGE